MSKKGEISLYEIQKVNKPPIEDVCDIILTAPELKEGMIRLLALSRELKMKPCWSHTNVYNCSYKGKRVVSYRVGFGDRWEENRLNINFFNTDKDDLDDFLQLQSDEMKTEYIDGMECIGCGGCAPGINLNILSK